MGKECTLTMCTQIYAKNIAAGAILSLTNATSFLTQKKCMDRQTDASITPGYHEQDQCTPTV